MRDVTRALVGLFVALTLVFLASFAFGFVLIKLKGDVP